VIKNVLNNDIELIIAANIMKQKFVTQTQALIHADLKHTGSVIMFTKCDHSTYVIDPKFAFYGPMALDSGAFLANLFLAYASQLGYESSSSFTIIQLRWHD
jgi:5-methylthioribose kinase